MISSFSSDAARLHENLRFIVIPLPLNTVNGKLANFTVDGSDGYIIADFMHRATTQPHTCVGPVRVTDGEAKVVLDIPNATIQIEAGAKEGPWQTIAAIFISGLDVEGRFWIIRSTGTADQTSLPIEGAVSDEAGLKGLVELAKWAG